MREKEMLKIVNFSKQYGSKIAVSNLNLLVQKAISWDLSGKMVQENHHPKSVYGDHPAHDWRYIC